MGREFIRAPSKDTSCRQLIQLSESLSCLVGTQSVLVTVLESLKEGMLAPAHKSSREVLGNSPCASWGILQVQPTKAGSERTPSSRWGYSEDQWKAIDVG